LNYQLRVIVFVENREDVDEETERVAILLKGLRIQAIIKPVWLNSGDGNVSFSNEYTKQLLIYKKNQRFAYIRNQRKNSKRRTLDNVVEGVTTPDSPVLAESEVLKKKKKVKPKRSFVVTKISKKLLRHYGSGEVLAEEVDIRDDLPLASPRSDPTSSSSKRNTPSESPTHADGDSDGDDEFQEKEGTSPYESASIFNTLDAMVQHRILNELMLHHSRESACIFR
jgi:hypothetical protein